MNKEKDFFKTCFDTIAGLEVKNESQAIAKEVVLSEIERLQQENKKLNGAIQTYDILLKVNVEENKQLKDNWNKLKEYINRYIKYDKYGRKISKCLNAIVIMNKINKLEQGSDSNE